MGIIENFSVLMARICKNRGVNMNIQMIIKSYVFICAGSCIYYISLWKLIGLFCC